MFVNSIFSYSQNIPTLLKTEIVIWATIILLSASTFNLDQSKILLLDKE